MSSVILCLAAALTLPAALPASATASPRPLLPPRLPAPARELLLADLTGQPDDLRLALTVLQGLVNREKPRLYIVQHPDWHGGACIPKWVQGLKDRGHSFKTVSDPKELLRTFRGLVRGCAVYEDGLKDEQRHKLNAISLWCSLESAVPLSERLLAELGLPVLLDARGRFGTAGEAYGWAYRELWPRAEHGAVAFVKPSNIVLRDYLTAHRIFPLWVSRGMTNAEEEICWSVVQEARPNSPVFGCWGGYGEEPAGRTSEAELQRLCSLRGKWVVVTDGCFNLTVHSALAYRRPVQRRSRPAPQLDSKAVYLTFSFTDGDNLQYVQQHLSSAQWWDDPNRGSVPIGWSMNPLAAELMPDVLEYFQRTATPADELICSTAGIGLIAPSLYGKDTDEPPDSLMTEYILATGEAMQKAGLRVIALGDTSNVPWTRADFRQWATALPWLRGILGDYGRAHGVFASNAAFAASGRVPVLRSLGSPGRTGPGPDSAAEFAKLVRSATPSVRPAFVHICLVNWFNSPTVVKDALALLGPDYVPVLPSEAMELYLEASRRAP